MTSKLQCTVQSSIPQPPEADEANTLSWIGDIGRDLVLIEMESKSQLAFENLDMKAIVAVVASLLKTPSGSEIYFLLPRNLNDGSSGLPQDVWFDGDVGAARNEARPAGKKVKITAIVGNPATADTMRLITKINKSSYLDSSDAHEIWVRRFLKGDTDSPADQLFLSQEDKQRLNAAIGGFLLSDPLSLDQAVRYLRRVRSLMVNGNRLQDAFGNALPTLTLPKDKGYFDTLKNPSSAQDWKIAFDKLYESRAGIVNGYLGADILLKEDLKEALESLTEKLSQKETVLKLCERAAEDPSDRNAMTELLECDWEEDFIGVFLTAKSRKDSKSSMAERTKEIIQQYFLVSSAQDNETLIQIQDYLDELKTRQNKKGAATEDDINFFNKNALYITRDETLVKKWGKFVYPNDFECDDFAEGLLRAANALFSADLKQTGELKTNRKLSVSFQSKQFKSYTEKVREEMMLYFGIMYRGFRDALGDAVRWKTDYQTSVDPLFEWRKWVNLKKIDVNRTSNRGEHAWSLKFVVSEIEVGSENGVPFERETGRKKNLVWKLSPESLACSTDRFVCGETKGSFVNCAAANPLEVLVLRSPNDSGRRGVISKATLTKASTLYQSGRKIRTVNADKIIRTQLTKRKAEISPDFSKLYEEFVEIYRKTVKEISDKGFNYLTASAVRTAYENLMIEASQLPPGDKTRSGILSPLLAIGTMRSTVGEKIFEIIPPWHPLRLYEIARHQRDAANAVRCTISGDAKIKIGGEYLALLRQESAQPSSPLMTVSLDEDLRNGGVPCFPVEHNHWYSLCAAIDEGSGDIKTQRDTERAVNELVEAIDSYENVEGPLSTAVKVLQISAEDHETNQLLKKKGPDAFKQDLDVELTLQAENKETAARIYNTLTGDYDRNGEVCDTPITSFRTRITMESLPELLKRHFRPSESTVRPFHIALMDMVGSSAAEFQWIPVKWIDTQPPETCHPNLSDRRKYVFDDETLSQLLLVSPALTECDAWFLRHVYYVCSRCEAGNAYRKDEIYMPVLEVRTHKGKSNKLGQILQDAHKLADWVVTCDGMLTKKQIAYNQNLVIRCKRSSSLESSSVIISSSASADSLDVMIKARLEELGKQNIRPDVETVRQRLFHEALTISGYIGLRAAKNKPSAGELIGLCLSKHILEDMITQECTRLNETHLFSAYLMLDDYASWFNNSKSDDHTIADIIAFGLTHDSERNLYLHILIAECKYRKDMTETKHSLAQTCNTVEKILRLLSDETNQGIESSLGMSVWLNRFANMIIDADISSALDSDSFYHYMNKIRKGDVKLTLNGYSHYFAFDQAGVSSLAESSVGDISVYQQIFDKNDVLQLMETLAGDNSPQSIVYASDQIAVSAYRFQTVPRIFKMTETVLGFKPEGPVDLGGSTDEFSTTGTEGKTVVGGACGTRKTESESNSSDRVVPAGIYGNTLSALISREVKPLGYSQARLLWCDHVASQLRQGLAENGISVKELRRVPTPNGCLVVYQGSNALGQKTFSALKEKLLMTRSLRIGFTEAAPGEFRVFIESEQREAVPMWNIWKDRTIHRHPDGSNTALAIALKELDGTILYLDPMSSQGAPHTLVAGGTGSGKSVLIRMMILDIAATNTPSQARLYMIDPKKGINYASLKKLPHWAAPFITERDEALSIMDELIAEMDRRYELFANKSVEDLFEYNRDHKGDELPVLWLFHDEIADWTRDKDYNREFTSKMTILATKARAAGIFLVLIAQRPDKDVLPMQVRDNLGNRLALKLETEASSKIALDKSGAELLLGKGHLAAKIGSAITYAQCAFLDNAQTAEATKAISSDFES